MLPISKIMLKCISGGSDKKEKPADPKLEVYGGGNAHHAGGTAVVTIPVTEKTDIKVYVSGDTANGVKGAGLGAVHHFW